MVRNWSHVTKPATFRLDCYLATVQLKQTRSCIYEFVGSSLLWVHACRHMTRFEGNMNPWRFSQRVLHHAVDHGMRSHYTIRRHSKTQKSEEAFWKEFLPANVPHILVPKHSNVMQYTRYNLIRVVVGATLQEFLCSSHVADGFRLCDQLTDTLYVQREISSALNQTNGDPGRFLLKVLSIMCVPQSSSLNLVSSCKLGRWETAAGWSPFFITSHNWPRNAYSFLNSKQGWMFQQSPCEKE